MSQDLPSPLTIDPLMNVGPDSITTLVDEGVEITGIIRIRTERAVLISGIVNGEIESLGPVIVNVKGAVNGSIRAKALQVHGRIHRRTDTDLVKIDGPLVLCQTAHLGCDAEAAGVQMAYGATIDGALRPNKLAEIQAVEVPVAAVEPALPTMPAEPAKPMTQSPEPAALGGLTDEPSVDVSGEFQDSVSAPEEGHEPAAADCVVKLDDVRHNKSGNEAWSAFSMEDRPADLPGYLRHRAV